MLSATKTTPSTWIGTRERNEYIRTARELGYGSKIIERIRNAKTITQIENAMTDGRRAM